MLDGGFVFAIWSSFFSLAKLMDDRIERFDLELEMNDENDPRARRYQEIALILRQHIRDRPALLGDQCWIEDVNREVQIFREQVIGLTREIEGEMTNVCLLDISNEELLNKVEVMTNSYVEQTNHYIDKIRSRGIYGWLVTVALLFVLMIWVSTKLYYLPCH